MFVYEQHCSVQYVKIFVVFEKRVETPNTVRFLQKSCWLLKNFKVYIKGMEMETVISKLAQEILENKENLANLIEFREERKRY